MDISLLKRQANQHVVQMIFCHRITLIERIKIRIILKSQI